ncbi:amidohydrolase family protein [Mucilaginibacter sp.]|jgi:cytosine/adenosine deaminase-related metal-dependent hydrolase|uniref:amidohydrolase family protein n=1 Tax=Mucilaginibacter sp. TaxID=1882438 RepID=UPI002C15471B|nr:amidohydrolase family protein [Mucilaginibacter sp.]HTI59666.1 amidohydrolase family protein [Mucilaginibacter sp.]
MKIFRADYVFPVCADPIKNGVITVNDEGKIISVSNNHDSNDKSVEYVKGIICPGFVNTHCHLELSHLKDKIPPREGLINFIKNIQLVRNADAGVITDAAVKADKEMYDNGIVAVGDICNSNITIPVKAQSKIYYHSFSEVFSFQPARAQEVFDKALALSNEFKPGSGSITPHSPYSVSKELYRLIKQYCETGTNLLSIHNQESDEENKFFRYRLGGFLDLYDHFGIDISHFKSQARNSLQSIIPLLTNKQEVLLVHNTCTNLKDIYFIKRFDTKVHFCFCPGANLYIEDKLPKVELFIDQGFNITLGTDSLASNTKLCILNEMRLLQERFPVLSTERLIQWATVNGARYLGIADEKGTIEEGKTPGLNLITGLDNLRITSATKVRRLI